MKTKKKEIKSETLPALRVEKGLSQMLDNILLQEQQKQRNPYLKKAMIIRLFIKESIERYNSQQSEAV